MHVPYSATPLSPHLDNGPGKRDRKTRVRVMILIHPVYLSYKILSFLRHVQSTNLVNNCCILVECPKLNNFCRNVKLCMCFLKAKLLQNSHVQLSLREIYNEGKNKSTDYRSVKEIRIIFARQNMFRNIIFLSPWNHYVAGHAAEATGYPARCACLYV